MKATFIIQVWAEFKLLNVEMRPACLFGKFEAPENLVNSARLGGGFPVSYRLQLPFGESLDVFCLTSTWDNFTGSFEVKLFDISFPDKSLNEVLDEFEKLGWRARWILDPCMRITYSDENDNL